MYEKSITREHRSAFVILIDQSASMSESVNYEGRYVTKAAAVAEVANQIVGELIERARRVDGIRDYYDVGVIGYSGQFAGSMLGDDDKVLVPITELAEQQFSDPDNFGSEVILPRARGETPMFEGLNLVYDSIREWCSRPENWGSFPPIVFNITDGESSDCMGCDMLNIARKIRSLTTSDGNVFMINIHIASDESQSAMIFPTPDEAEACANPYAQNLILASSTMPEVFNEMICEIRGAKCEDEFIGMSYNTSIAELVTILNIGTISVKKG